MNFAGKNGFREMHKMYSPVRRDHRRTTRFMEPYCFQGYRVLMHSRHVFLLIPPRGGGRGAGGVGVPKVREMPRKVITKN